MTKNNKAARMAAQASARAAQGAVAREAEAQGTPVKRGPRPEYILFKGEHGHELLVTAHVARIAAEPTTNAQIVGVPRRYCVAFAVGPGMATYGDFTEPQVGLFLTTLREILLGPPSRGSGMDLDRLAEMVKAKIPDGQIVQPDGPTLVLAGP